MTKKRIILILALVFVAIIVFIVWSFFYCFYSYITITQVPIPKKMTQWVEEHAADFADPIWLEENGFISAEEVNHLTLSRYIEQQSTGDKSKIYYYLDKTTSFNYPTGTGCGVSLGEIDLFTGSDEFTATGKCRNIYSLPLYHTMHGEEVPKISIYMFSFEQESGAKVAFGIFIRDMEEEEELEKIDTYLDALIAYPEENGVNG